MKKLRLEFPIFMSNCNIYLKVANNGVKTFLDKWLTQPVSEAKEKVSLEIEVPEKLDLIEVLPSARRDILEDVRKYWGITNQSYSIPGLQRLLIIMNESIHEIPVADEMADLNEWNEFIIGKGKSQCFRMPWALVIYVTETNIFGRFHWSRKLIGV